MDNDKKAVRIFAKGLMQDLYKIQARWNGWYDALAKIGKADAVSESSGDDDSDDNDAYTPGPSRIVSSQASQPSHSEEEVTNTRV